MHVCDYLLACDMEMDPTPGYAYTNWASGYGDLRAVPDLGTLRNAAWLDKSAVVVCDCVDDETHELVPVAPRSILRRQLARLADAGFTAKMGSELEFYLFRDTFREARAKHYQELRTAGDYIEDYHVLSSTFAEPVIGAIRRLVDASAIGVEFSKGEWGPGQHEINLRYAEALEMADRHVLYKTAAQGDRRAARPLADLHGEVERRDGGVVAARAHEPVERPRPSRSSRRPGSRPPSSGTSSAGCSPTRASSAGCTRRR